MNKITVLFILLTISQSVFSQVKRDSITLEDLKPFSHDFSITKGALSGPGAKVLADAVANVQFTMLGVNGRSKLEAALGQAFIKELDQHAYQTMVLEAGMASGEVIRKLTKVPSSTVQNIKALNQKYAFDIKDLKIAPIPEVRSTESSQMVQEAAEKDWSILSIGTEYWTGYRMFADELYHNLPLTKRPFYKDLYHASTQLLDEAYEQINGQGYDDIKAFISTIETSGVFHEFLQEMSAYEKNKKITKALLFSLDYWKLYGNRDAYTKNKLNSKKNKERLMEELKEIDFDITKDKLFIQMWKNHMVKGTTPNGFYGIGNTLHELAEINGSTSLNIGIVPRFYEENGDIKDALLIDNFWNNSYKEFIPLGKKETWVVIDLRSFNEKFHWGPFHVSSQMNKIITRFDMLIIPKLNTRATINY